MSACNARLKVVFADRDPAIDAQQQPILLAHHALAALALVLPGHLQLRLLFHLRFRSKRPRVREHRVWEVAGRRPILLNNDGKVQMNGSDWQSTNQLTVNGMRKNEAL